MHLLISIFIVGAVSAAFPGWLRLCEDGPEESTSDNTVTSLPAGCISYGNKVYCKHSTFSAIPTTFPTTTTCLVIEECTLSELVASGLNYLTALRSFAVVNIPLVKFSGSFGGDSISLTKLVFRKTKLSHFPVLGGSVRALEVSSSLIQSLDTTSLRYTHLSSLNISNNPFDLETGSLQGLPVTLQQLFMTKCPISLIQEGTFPTLPRLVTLEIGTSSVQRNAFQGVSSVNNLKLDTCHLETFALEDLKNIVILNLDHSCKEGDGNLVLKKYAFSGMDKLAQLNIDSAGVERIPTKAFSGLPRILYITLRNNPLRAIMQGAFDGLTTLAEVYISHVSRDKNEENTVLLGDNTFSYANLPNLRILDISSLNLWNVTPPTLMNLRRLMDVSFNGNMLHFLINGTLSNLPHLHTIYMGDNPWNCDCNLRWLKEMTDAMPEKFRDIPLVTCSTPPPLAGSRFQDLSPDDFQCPSFLPMG